MNLFRITKGTSAIAEERLKLILVQDRSLLPPAKFEQMKEDIVDIMSNYFDFNTADIVINIQRESKKFWRYCQIVSNWSKCCCFRIYICSNR